MLNTNLNDITRRNNERVELHKVRRCEHMKISPKLVKWFGHAEWFKNMWTGEIDSMVRHLWDIGYESTPYEDRKW